MKTEINLRKPTTLKKSILYLIALIALLMLSCCDKQEIDDTIEFRLTFVAWNDFETKAEGIEKRGYRPSTAVMTTDKGTLTFEIVESSENRFAIKPKMIKSDKYHLIDVSLYDKEGNKTHYMKSYQESVNGEVVSAIGLTYDYTDGNFNYILQVFFN